MLFKGIMVNNTSSNRKLKLIIILTILYLKNKNKIFPSNCQEDAPKPLDELRLVRSRKKNSNNTYLNSENRLPFSTTYMMVCVDSIKREKEEKLVGRNKKGKNI